MSQAFSIATTLPAGTQTAGPITVPAGVSSVEGVMSAGPMPSGSTAVQLLIERSTDGGATYVAVGGLTASGGMTGPRGGPATDGHIASAVTYSALAHGDRLRATAIVANPPAGGLPVSFVGTTS